MQSKVSKVSFTLRFLFFSTLKSISLPDHSRHSPESGRQSHHSHFHSRVNCSLKSASLSDSFFFSKLKTISLADLYPHSPDSDRQSHHSHFHSRVSCRLKSISLLSLDTQINITDRTTAVSLLTVIYSHTTVTFILASIAVKSQFYSQIPFFFQHSNRYHCQTTHVTLLTVVDNHTTVTFILESIAV